MRNLISTELWICIVIPFSITVAKKPYSITKFDRYKRSFGFGFSNPIFSRVFNPYDNRPLAAKFFGNDDVTQYATNIGHSQYQPDSWNYDSCSDDHADFGVATHQKKAYIHKYEEGRKVKDDSKNQFEPSYKIISKNSKDVMMAKKNQVKKITSGGEYNFKLLPLYDIKKSFRTLIDIKRLEENNNSFKPKDTSVKTSTMEYIFNLLPHYEIRNAFRSIASSTIISLGSKNTSKNTNDIPLKKMHNSSITDGFKWPIETVIQSSDLNNLTERQRTIKNNLKTQRFTHISSRSKESKLTLLLPNKSVEHIFRSNPKVLLPLNTKPSILINEGEKKRVAPLHKDHTYSFKSESNSISNLAKYEKDNSLESKNAHSTIEKSTQLVEITNTFLHKNFGHINNTNALEMSNTYIPHRTKILKSYSQFLSLPAVIIYEKFNNNRNTFAKPRETINKSINFNKTYSRLPNITPKHQIHKTEPLTQRTSIEFISTTESMINSPNIIFTTNMFSTPDVKTFQSYLESNKVDMKKSPINEYSFKNTTHCKICNSIRISNSTNSKNTSNSTILENQIQIYNSSAFIINGNVSNIKNNFKPNIPKSNKTVVSSQYKESSDMSVKYITRSVIVKPIRGDMPEIISLLPEDTLNDKAEFVYQLPSERHILHTVPKFKTNSRRKFKQNRVLLPANTEDSEYLKVHHVRRKPPTFSNFTSPGLERIYDQDSRAHIALHTDNGYSRTLITKDQALNIPHKRLRFDAKRLPTEKTINFRTLPYYVNKGVHFNPKMVYQIADNKDNKLVTKRKMQVSLNR